MDTGICTYCCTPIRWSATEHKWFATDYADINGYCISSPELEHIAEKGDADVGLEQPERWPAAADQPGWWQPYTAQFPGWHAWTGVNSLCYALRPKTSPPWVVRAESAQELAERIRSGDRTP